MLIPSVLLFIFGVNIENGIGTGWTLKTGKELFYSDIILKIKLFSMRETFQIILFSIIFSIKLEV